MIFSRTYRYDSSMPAEAIKGRLIGKHVKVHNMDFEVSEKDRVLRIIPHAEQETNIKTLPITHVEFKGKGDKTQVVINSKMRKIDSGGPMLILIFCTFMLIAAVGFYIFGQQEYLNFTYTLAGISLAIFVIFWMRMEAGYFDYVRKLRDYIKKESVVN
ncbi:hypothetical protein [Polluticoccus soli]|uniref:hypothetical protein n=1 Tax=Polluticoccus soli TaxID=3034150 RepID=UPI0023E1AE44|nr:hypothetical protein [Flavipsychrobacter sp. JY13-12]